MGSIGWHSSGAYHGNWGSYIAMYATENYTSGAQGTDLRMFCCPNGSVTPVEALRVTATKVTVTDELAVTGMLGIGTFTVATLPAAGAHSGKSANVNDSSVNILGNPVAGGGSYNVTVRSNGTSWLVASREALAVTHTPTGTTQTINLSASNYQELVLTSATGTVTVTLTVPGGPSTGNIWLKQHASAVRDIVWNVSSGTVKWLGTQPTWNTDANGAERVISWMWAGGKMFLSSSAIAT
jgi:hypothetical protein